MKFPNIYEIARAARSTVEISRALTREQHADQDELRSAFKMKIGGPAAGVVLPWYAERRQRGAADRRELRFTDRRGERVSISLGADTEERDASATGGDHFGFTIGQAVPEIGAALRDRLVLEQLGARVLGGLRDDVNLPRAKATLHADWLSETAATTDDTDELFAQLALTPRRITASLPVSDQLLLQGEAVESFLRSELMAALAVELQRAIIAGAGGAEPAGLLTYGSGIGLVEGGADGAAPIYANLCDLEHLVTGVAKADRGHLGWLVSPAVRKKLRQTPLFAGGSVPIWRENEAESLLGHAAGVTPSVPDDLTKGASTNCSLIAFGEMSELCIGLWGSGVIVSAIRDAALARTGKTLVIGTLYADGGLRSPEAFAMMKDALCSS
jgi:HK97 family phage major capsid protein